MANTKTIYTASAEWVRVRVAATKLGVAYSPASDTVQIAFVAPGSSIASATWNNATWETVAATSTYYAGVLVGTGGVVLAAGTYSVFCKVTDSPETPVKFAGTLKVI